MRSDIFGKWLEYTNSKFQAQNRKILLLIDNASSHFNPDEHETNENLNLSHVKVHFLPPNTTAICNLWMQELLKVLRQFISNIIYDILYINLRQA